VVSIVQVVGGFVQQHDVRGGEEQLGEQEARRCCPPENVVESRVKSSPLKPSPEARPRLMIEFEGIVMAQEFRQAVELRSQLLAFGFLDNLPILSATRSNSSGSVIRRRRTWLHRKRCGPGRNAASCAHAKRAPA